MAYKQFNMADLIAAIQNKIQDKTGILCYDSMNDNASRPFYFAEAVEKRPVSSKTMYTDAVTVAIHVMASKAGTSADRYKLIQQMEEALTEDIELQGEFDLIMQTNCGITPMDTKEINGITKINEEHTVVSYEFIIGYGFKCKI